MNILKRANKKGDKIIFYYYFGRGPGQRPSTGIFIYKKPSNQIQKNHNKEALALLETKRSQLIIEKQAIGSAFIPTHKFKANFLEYYEEYLVLNKRKGNRHLSNSLIQFKAFTGKDYISSIDITENFCKRFRQYLLDKFTGETPGGYYARFKWVVKAATNDGYFQRNPTENVAAKSNPSTKLKENLEVPEYLILLNTPCFNEEVKAAFVFCCYTGLRWVDVKKLEWKDIGNGIISTIEKLDFSVNSRVWKKADLFTLMVELHRALFKQKVSINARELFDRLKVFYDLVDNRDFQENDIVNSYRKATASGTNDRSSRILRGEVIYNIISGKLTFD